MKKDATAVGRFDDEWGRTYQRLQILTLAALFQGKNPAMPYVEPASVQHVRRDERERPNGLIYAAAGGPRRS